MLLYLLHPLKPTRHLEWQPRKMALARGRASNFYAASAKRNGEFKIAFIFTTTRRQHAPLVNSLTSPLYLCAGVAGTRLPLYVKLERGLRFARRVGWGVWCWTPHSDARPLKPHGNTKTEKLILPFESLMLLEQLRSYPGVISYCLLAAAVGCIRMHNSVHSQLLILIVEL